MRIIDSLPADTYEKVSSLGVNEIEWLSIFLSISEWKVHTRLESFCKDETDVELDASQFPIINLAIQLGYVEKGGSENGMKLFRLPLFKHARKLFLWENKNLLQCSMHIDNWISLKSGSQLEEMTKTHLI